MILIKNIQIYSPENLGVQDILLCGNKIELIDNNIDINLDTVEIIDGTGKIAIPGIIDRHVHVIGGGGEGGVSTRAPEIKCSELINNGITTVLGLLGTDATTRTMRELIAKVKALNELGISAYALTGSYQYPPQTLTDSVRDDIVFIKEIQGSKIALSDHRSSFLSNEELTRLASDVYVGGKLSGKKGILVIHMGDGKQGLSPILNSIETSNIPASVYQPTHINRNPNLLTEGIDFLKAGGYIDLTTGINDDNRAGDVIKQVLDSGINPERLTLSSDGNGSFSSYDKDGNLLEIGVASVSAMYNELLYLVKQLNVPLEKALPFFTLHPASAIGLSTYKGRIKSNYDADLLILDDDLSINSVIAKGKILLDNKKIAITIPFE